mmetsp:Transcript_24219/g.36707  ORF Transcript_24219/g.36707 Transcript_24219/m.36707 type:complete len:407 (+) Transcript_24219:147-1367(+)
MYQIDKTKASEKNAESDAPAKCAGCGKEPFDVMMENSSSENKSSLKRCTACYSVRYCGVPCQKSHRKAHKKECKATANKRREFNAALNSIELNEDNDLTPPPSPQDCDLCMYRMPPGARRSKYFACCGKVVCKACFGRSTPGNFLDMFGNSNYENLSQMERINLLMSTFGPNGTASAEKRDEQRGCPFCRSTDDMVPYTIEHHKIRERCLLLRANKGDSRALLELACLHKTGYSGDSLDKLKGDREFIFEGTVRKGKRSPEGDAKAFEYFQKSAALGNGDAYYYLSEFHRQDYNAADFFDCLVKAAALGSVEAHDELASLAMEKKQIKVAMKHYQFLALVGYSKESTEKLTAGYKDGYVTKEELASSLRAYQAAREEFSSKERAQMELMSAGVTSDGKVKPSRMYM